MEHPHKEPAANHKVDMLEHYIRRASKQGKIKNSKLFGKLYPKSMTATLSRSTVALFYREVDATRWNKTFAYVNILYTVGPWEL